MGFAIKRDTINDNLKVQHRVHEFIDHAGLKHVRGLAEHLMALPVEDLGNLSNDDWNGILNQALAGMPFDPAMNKRIHAAIHELRVRYSKEVDEQHELAELRHLIHGGAHPARQEAREAHEAAAAAQAAAQAAQQRGSSGATTAEEPPSFIWAPYFQGEHPGYEFKDGTEGLGYYRETKPTTKVWSRYGNGNNSYEQAQQLGHEAQARAALSQSVATGPRQGAGGGVGGAGAAQQQRPTGFNPVEQRADQQHRLQQQSLQRQQLAEQRTLMGNAMQQRPQQHPGAAMLLRPA